MRRDLIALPEASRVWIYQADRVLRDEESDLVKDEIYNFTMSWSSHGKELDTYGHLFHYQFLVLVADASNLPSGCSIDSSVHFVESLGNKFNVDFFNRMNFAYMDGESVKTIASKDLPRYYKEGKIDEETYFFDNLVNSKEAFINGWIKPLQESWHKRFI